MKDFTKKKKKNENDNTVVQHLSHMQLRNTPSRKHLLRHWKYVVLISWFDDNGKPNGL